MGIVDPILDDKPMPYAITSFIPKSEWKEEDGGLILQVHLPGCSEKHINCRIVEPWRYIRVCSDPAIKTTYFNTTFDDIPEKFNLNEAETQFRDGILTIRIPKFVRTAQTGLGELEATAFQEAPSPQDTTGKPDTPPKQTLNTNINEEITEGKDSEAIRPLKVAIEPISQKGQDESPLKATSLADGRNQIDENIKEKEKRTTETVVALEKEEKEKSERATSDDKERQFIVDKCVIVSAIVAVGAYIFYVFRRSR